MDLQPVMIQQKGNLIYNEHSSISTRRGFMTNEIWQDITDDYNRENGEERYIRTIDPKCWISVLYRKTGFGWYKCETAIVFLHDTGDRQPTWKDRDCLIIAGDRREELTDVPKEKLRDWYEQNIRKS